MLNIEKRKSQLCTYMAAKHIPRTTNLIECFNSHLEGRLKTIKGFELFTHADTWLNGYFLKRRITKFTDCEKQFRSLNGKCSLELTMKDPTKIARVLKLLR